ncbi:MAG TPA: chorismate mutase [Gemmatimonadaceae bacterium]|nr:chorismate mutase [Gemmatimonadaceae bacterium]
MQSQRTSSEKTSDITSDVTPEQQRAAERVESLRASIDRIDEMLVSLIGERQRLARAVGVAKRVAAMPPVDASREHDVIQRIATHAADHGVNETEARLLADQLIRLARTTQGLPVVSRRDAAAA